MSGDYAVSYGWWYSIIAVLILYMAFEWWHTRKDHVVRLKEATLWTCIYIGAGLLFAIPVYVWIAPQAAGEYITAFFTEKALSIDNLFVFGLIFSAFKLPRELERRVLNYGIFGAIIFRLAFILAGIALLEKFAWISIVFGAILLRATLHAYRDASDRSSQKEVTESRTWRILSRLLPFKHVFSGNRLTIKDKTKRYLTMLAAVILIVELTDILFAVDSVPAVLAITTNRFIAYSSNIFALLGLRALYFVYAHVADRFWAVKWGITVILGWISIKLIAEPFGLHISSVFNLGLILGTLIITVMLSIVYRGDNPPTEA